MPVFAMSSHAVLIPRPAPLQTYRNVPRISEASDAAKEEATKATKELKSLKQAYDEQAAALATARG